WLEQSRIRISNGTSSAPGRYYIQPKSPKLLDDIRDAAAFIRQVTDGKSLEAYRADRLLRQAVERNFEIIGEAVGRLARTDPDLVARIGRAPPNHRFSQRVDSRVRVD